MNALFLIVLIAVLAALRPALRTWRQHQTRREWLELAPRLELSLVTGDDRRLLAGRYQGHPVEVLVSPDGTAQMRMKTRAALPPGLHLSRQEPGATRLQLRGMKDIQTGQPALDEAFIIQGKNPAAVIRLLREPGVGEALLTLQADSPRAVLTEDELVAPFESPIQEDACRRALRALAKLSITLERVAGQRETPAATAPEPIPSEPAPIESPAPEPGRPENTTVPEKGRELPDREARREAIREEFAQRVSLHNVIAMYPLVTGCILLLMGRLFSHWPRLLGLRPLTWTMLGSGAILLSLVGALYSDSKVLLCPSCGRHVLKSTPEQRRRMAEQGERPPVRSRGLESVVACPHCGVRLR